MVKIRHTGFLKLNLKLYKKMHFRFLPKFSQVMDEVEHFLDNFQILGPSGCQGWVVIPQNVKKAKFTVPLCPLFSVHWKGACNSCDILNQHEQG